MKKRKSYGIPYISAKIRRIWKPIICNMGPFWHSMLINGQTRKTLEKHGIAEFVIGESFILGRLTPFGLALRDRWHLAEARALDRKYRNTDKRRSQGGRYRRDRLNGED